MVEFVRGRETDPDAVWIGQHRMGRSRGTWFVFQGDRKLADKLPTRAAAIAVAERRATRARRDVALDKKALWKEIDKDQRRKDREKVAAMRARIHEARQAGPAAREAAKESCSAGRTNARAKALEIRARHKEEARKDVASLRAATRAECAVGKKKHRFDVARLREELLAERKHQKEMRAIARSARSRAVAERRRPGVMKARERLGESDDEVRANIPPDLIPLFNKVRRSIKGSSRKSRTEEFLEYAEEHPGEEYAAIEDKTEALVRELERQQRSGRRDRSRSRHRLVGKRRDPSQLRMFGEAGHGQLDLYTTTDPDVYVVYVDRGVRSTKRLRRSEARSFLKSLPKGSWTRETREVARALGVR